MNLRMFSYGVIAIDGITPYLELVVTTFTDILENILAGISDFSCRIQDIFSRLAARRLGRS